MNGLTAIRLTGRSLSSESDSLIVNAGQGYPCPKG